VRNVVDFDKKRTGPRDLEAIKERVARYLRLKGKLRSTPELEETGSILMRTEDC